MLCYTLPPYLWQAVLPSACREMNYPMLCLTNNFAASYRCHVVLIRATAFYIMLVSSSYIRIGNQLTKCNVDDSKRIKAKEIKLITVFVQNMCYIVTFIKFRSLNQQNMMVVMELMLCQF